MNQLQVRHIWNGTGANCSGHQPISCGRCKRIASALMKRDFYSASITEFRNTAPEEILGQLAANNPFTLEQTQRNAWLEEIDILQDVLSNREGFVYFEY